MPIVAEQFVSTKMAVSGRTAEWVAGDEVKINSTTASVAISDNKAYLQGDVLEANVYRSIYPASIAPAGTLNTDTVSITLPSTYTYREADGKQQLSLPMAAAGREFPLMFRHLTAGLVVNVSDSVNAGGYNRTLYLDKITVVSSGYQLSGQYTFDITDLGNNALCTTSNSNDTIVTMNFDNEAVSIPFGNSKQVFIPVPAVGSANKFKVTVSAHYNNGAAIVMLAKTLKQEVGGSLGRNTLAYVPIKIKGTDTQSADDVIPDADEDGSILIGTVTDFNQYASLIKTKSKGYDTMRYKLTADLDFGNSMFTPIENFAGTFNGNGHAIRNIKIGAASTNGGTYKYYSSGWTSGTTPSPIPYGLFTNLGGATIIENLTLQNVVIDASSYAGSRRCMMIGAFVGYTTKNVTIRNCSVDNFSILSSSTQTISNDTYVQVGICVGYAASNVTIENCTISNSTPTACIYNNPASNSSKKHHMYYGGLLGLLGSGTFTATNNTLSGEMHVAFNGGFYSSNNGRYLTGTLLGCKAAGSTVFNGNTSTDMKLYKPGSTARSETTQAHQESGN
ncbi:MAG: hypothetical protein IJ764_05225 [Bacteroidales bacterium]|nr:hypothetical protein [Bacteroidales bacterium]